LLVLLALLTTIGVATFTYVWHSLDTSLVDALYFSVGMITGAGGQEQVAENSPAAIKVFTAVMMLVGAGVIGICYALLNDFILGAHFQRLWSVARMPRQNHYVVCGLGGVGYRITLHGFDLLDLTLTAGDVLYLTMPANRLHQLRRNTIEWVSER
jgi:hypothetical protein